MRTIHPLLLGKKKLFTYSNLSHKLYALCHKSLKDISPRIRYHSNERLRLVYTYAQHDRELVEVNIDAGESTNQALSSGNAGPQRRLARMGHDQKSEVIFFDLFYEVFPKRKKKILNLNCFY